MTKKSKATEKSKPITIIWKGEYLSVCSLVIYQDLDNPFDDCSDKIFFDLIEVIPPIGDYAPARCQGMMSINTRVSIDDNINKLLDMITQIYSTEVLNRRMPHSELRN